MTNINIIVLGLSGSGKTVYLASLYNKLRFQNEEIGFFLEMEDSSQANRLIKTYDQAANVEKPWPPGTTYGEVSEWNFKCCVKTPELEKFIACHFTYLDYAGGRLDNIIDENSDPEFDSKLKNANVILALLDGQKVLDSMKNQGDLVNLETGDLSYIYKYITDANKDNPVHFVITKWDIIKDQYDLSQIREKLLELRLFKEFVKMRRQARCPVRLIPVSSLGFDFAEIQPDGSMKKLPDRKLNPYQVEMPIACVIPDIIELTLEQYKSKIIEEKNQSITEVEPDFSFGENARRNVAKIIQTINYTFEDFLPQDPIEKIIKYVDKPARDKELEANNINQENIKMQKQKIHKIIDEKTALEYVITCFYKAKDTLDCRFPESELHLSFYDE